LLALLAETYGTVGQPEAGLRVLAEALTVVETTGERQYAAELYRLTGELTLQQCQGTNAHLTHPQAEAAAYFHKALEIAHQQSAKSLELRAAMSLSRLWQHQDRAEEARQLLAPIYGWFTEGFDTADLQEARALLETLG
jgi:predicted ATPase